MHQPGYTKICICYGGIEKKEEKKLAKMIKPGLLLYSMRL